MFGVPKNNGGQHFFLRKYGKWQIKSEWAAEFHILVTEEKYLVKEENELKFQSSLCNKKEAKSQSKKGLLQLGPVTVILFDEEL